MQTSALKATKGCQGGLDDGRKRAGTIAYRYGGAENDRGAWRAIIAKDEIWPAVGFTNAEAFAGT